METGQRGFCITRKQECLEPYTVGGKEFDVLIEQEKKLVSDNPSQPADSRGEHFEPRLVLIARKPTKPSC